MKPKVTVLLTIVTTFLSAFLLFAIQPMASKSLLPTFGGVPMVWTVCMLYFQTILLMSYSYAFLLNHYLSFNTQKIIHATLLILSILLSLPILWENMPTMSSSFPTITLLKLLSYKITIPLFLLSATAPLLQAWFARSSDPKAKDPYFFYIASNLGSLVALLSYPFLVERYFGLHDQSLLWSLLYLIFGIFLTFIVVITKENVRQPKLSVTHPTLLNKLGWLYLSFVPVSLMLGVTTFLSTDIASIPLLWVLPLSLYLLSFIITFSRKPLISHAFVKNNVIFILIYALLGFIVGPNNEATLELVIVHLALLFMLSLLCHGELYKLRPAAKNLTSFYLYLALGGVLAGLFNSIIAPNFFVQAYEYPIAIILAIAALSSASDKIKWSQIGFITILLLLNKLIPTSWVVYQTYTPIPIFCLILMILNTKNMKHFSCMLAVFFSLYF